MDRGEVVDFRFVDVVIHVIIDIDDLIDIDADTDVDGRFVVVELQIDDMGDFEDRLEGNKEVDQYWSEVYGYI